MSLKNANDASVRSSRKSKTGCNESKTPSARSTTFPFSTSRWESFNHCECNSLVRKDSNFCMSALHVSSVGVAPWAYPLRNAITFVLVLFNALSNSANSFEKLGKLHAKLSCSNSSNRTLLNSCHVPRDGVRNPCERSPLAASLSLFCRTYSAIITTVCVFMMLSKRSIIRCTLRNGCVSSTNNWCRAWRWGCGIADCNQ